jgi:hypothetical protein
MEQSNAELQRKMDRQSFAASRLQRAHNRALRRLQAAALERDGLRKIIEMHPSQEALQFEYRLWCHRFGIPTPEEKAEAKARAQASHPSLVLAGGK